MTSTRTLRAIFRRPIKLHDLTHYRGLLRAHVFPQEFDVGIQIVRIRRGWRCCCLARRLLGLHCLVSQQCGNRNQKHKNRRCCCAFLDHLVIPEKLTLPRGPDSPVRDDRKLPRRSHGNGKSDGNRHQQIQEIDPWSQSPVAHVAAGLVLERKLTKWKLLKTTAKPFRSRS
jgi:hypothetical protein